MTFFVNDTNISVSQKVGDGVESLGNISDSCCNTLLVFKNITYQVIFERIKGSGGYVGKKEYLIELMNAFKLVYNSDELKAKLMKYPISISKQELENGTYINRL